MGVTRPKYYIGTCRGKGECNSPLRNFCEIKALLVVKIQHAEDVFEIL